MARSTKPLRPLPAPRSPSATFIAYNYNTPVDVAAFEAECGWMVETWHPHCHHSQRVKARINYTVWSEVFACPNPDTRGHGQRWTSCRNLQFVLSSCQQERTVP